MVGWALCINDVEDKTFYIFSISQNVSSDSGEQQAVLRQGDQAVLEDPRVEAELPQGQRGQRAS